LIRAAAPNSMYRQWAKVLRGSKSGTLVRPPLNF
jgi:hypothetical protein